MTACDQDIAKAAFYLCELVDRGAVGYGIERAADDLRTLVERVWEVVPNVGHDRPSGRVDEPGFSAAVAAAAEAIYAEEGPESIDEDGAEALAQSAIAAAYPIIASAVVASGEAGDGNG